MKIVRFMDSKGQVFFGTELEGNSAELLEGDLFEGLRRTGHRQDVARRLAPVNPPNVYGIGMNYREAALRTGAALPSYPAVFMKPTTAVANPGDKHLATLCSTEIHVKGKAPYQQLPKPRPFIRRLLDAARVRLPDKLPSKGIAVTTKTKLPAQRIT